MRRILMLAAASGAIGIALPAQVATRTLSRPQIELSEPLTKISALRELRDGRVLVVEQREKKILLVDLARQKSTAVSRQGAGPREYGVPAVLLAMPGDTTWVYDPVNRRWLILDPGGAPIATIPERETSAELSRGDVIGSDARGRLYVQVEPRGERPSLEGSPGIAYVLRVFRDPWRAETVGSLRLPLGRATGARSLPGGKLRRINNRPLAPEDVAAVAPDGRVAFVRAPEYRVDWFAADGSMNKGTVIDYTRVTVNAAEKRVFITSQTVPGQIIVIGPQGASAPAPPRMTRMPAGALDEEADGLPWPAHLPPFVGGARVAPNGVLWVPRTRAHSDSIPSFDLIDARGQPTGRVLVPSRTRLLGFGVRAVYLVRVDDDDFEYLQRYAWP